MLDSSTDELGVAPMLMYHEPDWVDMFLIIVGYHPQLSTIGQQFLLIDYAL